MSFHGFHTEVTDPLAACCTSYQHRAHECDSLLSGSCKVLTKETWRVWNFLIAQMARGQLDTEEQMKSTDCRHVQPRWANHMLFVQHNNQVFLLSPAHWLLLSLSGGRSTERKCVSAETFRWKWDGQSRRSETWAAARRPFSFIASVFRGTDLKLSANPFRKMADHNDYTIRVNDLSLTQGVFFNLFTFFSSSVPGRLVSSAVTPAFYISSGF